MSNIVDIRPDRILRELREHGSLPRACSAAHITAPVLKDLLIDYPKFAISLAECMKESAEEAVLLTQAKKYKTLKARYTLAKELLDKQTADLIREARNAAFS